MRYVRAVEASHGQNNPEPDSCLSKYLRSSREALEDVYRYKEVYPRSPSTPAAIQAQPGWPTAIRAPKR
jgi:hypothetical protein